MAQLDLSEREFAEALDSRSSVPVYDIMKRARVGIAGLGGLGSNIAAALARAGVGRIAAADFDAVELSNINRQMYTLRHIGMKKAEAMTQIIAEINPFCDFEAHDIRVTADNISELFGDCDIICEAFDVAEQKASPILPWQIQKYPQKYLVCGSGMAGRGRANEITTRRITDRFFICGDGVTDVADGDGLTAARVTICAGHQASKIIEIILKGV